MRGTDSPEIIKLLAAAGGELSEIDSGARRRLLSRSTRDLDNEEVHELPFQVTKQDYEKYRSRRFGSRNPERMNNPFWEEMRLSPHMGDGVDRISEEARRRYEEKIEGFNGTFQSSGS